MRSPGRLVLTGQTFGYLTVIGYSERVKTIRGIYRYFFPCRCVCGNKTKVTSDKLNGGLTKSCGCKKNVSKETHGFLKKTTRGSEDPNLLKFYSCFKNMHQRCSNPNIVDFKNYGERGVRVDARWNCFTHFKSDMFDSYLDHLDEFGAEQTSIERIDVDGNYSPENCRWATNAEQSKNQRRWKNKRSIREEDTVVYRKVKRVVLPSHW